MKTEKSFIGNRREFVAGGLSAALLLSLPESLFAFSKKAEKKHPYLLFDQGDIKRIKSNIESPLLREYWKSLLAIDLAPDYKFFNEEIDFNKHSPHLGKTCTILLRNSFLAFITKEKKYLDIALLAIDKLLGFREWDFFTEGGDKIIGFNSAPNAIHSMCCAYDWLYDHLSDEKRKVILEAIESKGVEPCYLSVFGMRNPDKVKGWDLLSTTKFSTRVDYTNWPKIFNTNNIKITALTGLALGYCLLDSEGIKNEKYKEMIKWGMSTSHTAFNEDGSFDEGIPYWAYTMYYYNMAIECTKRHLNLDYSRVINFGKNSEFIVKMMAPTKFNRNLYINFCDGGMLVSCSPCFWIAAKFKDGLAQYIAEKYLDNLDIFSFINYNRLVKSKQPSQRLLDSNYKNGWVISRTGFEIDDTVLAFRSGVPVNHEHADRNSMILNAYGDRLLNDPFEAGYSAKDKKWNLRQTSAHTAVLIDGKGHQYHDGREGTNKSQAEAKIISFDSSSNFMSLSSDASEAYKLVNNDVKKVIRMVLFVKPDLIIIIDRMEKSSNASSLSARYQIFNRDSLGSSTIADNKSFVINRPSAKLYCNIFCAQDGSLIEDKLDLPDDFIPHPFVDHSASTPKTLSAHPFVEFTAAAAKETEIISFLCITRPDKNPFTVPLFKREGDCYSFELSRDGKPLKVKFDIINDKIKNITLNK